MLHTDFHTHTTFCDGKSTPREMVEAAYRMGMTDFGVSWMFLIDCSFIIAGYPSKSISFGHFHSPKMKGSFCAGCTKQKKASPSGEAVTEGD